MIMTHYVWELAVANAGFSIRRVPFPNGKGANLLFNLVNIFQKVQENLMKSHEI